MTQSNQNSKTQYALMTIVVTLFASPLLATAAAYMGFPTTSLTFWVLTLVGTVALIVTGLAVAISRLIPSLRQRFAS